MFVCVYGQDILDTLSSDRALAKHHLPTVARLAYQCPFDDVKDAFSAFMASQFPNKVVKESGSWSSAFVESKNVCGMDDAPTDTRAVLEDVFCMFGRVSNADVLSGWHGTWLSQFKQTLHFIMHADG
jgi:hypothetical protein